ncbi:SGNH/GDSL hydrolase family protein [Brachybacterium sacelli]|uniref:Lysophospholipase L1-like esterase n=1 Tax=Brachybacterium sacelli TaxID=173364 RepID=A0ABS4WX28_9MICO|nr:SGNH/GDSL hydrolase family protein [Brachybacterium sacelli]MBP2380743.1 lysophospholipase L1-like esterase [Brachybacterium sacelli]
MHSTPLAPDLVRGLAELEPTARGLRTHRLPAWARAQFPDPQVLSMEQQPSGGRLSLRTGASQLELELHATRVAFRGAERPRGRVDVVIDGELVLSDPLTGGDALEVDLATGESVLESGPTHRTVLQDVGAEEKEIELWLPHNEGIELVALRTDEPVLPLDPGGQQAWVHYGSSISQGSNAASPTRIWPVVAARAAGRQLRNLGLGGGALLDPFVARTIRDAPADVISLELGINIVNLDGFRRRTLVPAVHGFLDTIREGHPHTPIHLISPLFCGIHERTPGPGMVDPASIGTDQVRFAASGTEGDTELGRLTLEVFREALEDVMDRREDANLHHVDGLALYGEADAAEHPLPDGLHPDTETHRLIGERFAAQVFGAEE